MKGHDTLPPAVTAQVWDVLIVGAGLAGAMTALCAAKRGMTVLLIDAKAFPREKVCGGCLNPRAIDILRTHNLLDAVLRAGAVPIDELQLSAGGPPLRVPLPAGLAISRSALDPLIVAAAVGAGATFLAETTGVVEPQLDGQGRAVAIHHQGAAHRVCARLVVSAEGLARSSVKQCAEIGTTIGARSRLGLGATLDDEPAEFPAGRIQMGVGRDGYVGITRLEHGRLNMACAINPAALRQGDRPGAVVRRILQEAKLALPATLETARWHGTPLLTNRPGRVALPRLFLIGDAAGYVEPFTGEGMAAALEGAIQISTLLPAASVRWDDRYQRQWAQMHRQSIGRRQWVCRWLARLLRHPRFLRVALRGCQWLPTVPALMVSRISQPEYAPADR